MTSLQAQLENTKRRQTLALNNTTAQLEELTALQDAGVTIDEAIRRPVRARHASQKAALEQTEKHLAALSAAQATAAKAKRPK